eukprot:GFYU01009903.1.p1 GENE.GFYU01009903.1~~GFYU01009903.1.p1  ORF type:complete len:294 (-),score=47.19 GFYU01009903.1:195-1034(-)
MEGKAQFKRLERTGSLSALDMYKEVEKEKSIAKEALNKKSQSRVGRHSRIDDLLASTNKRSHSAASLPLASSDTHQMHAHGGLSLSDREDRHVRDVADGEKHRRARKLLSKRESDRDLNHGRRDKAAKRLQRSKDRDAAAAAAGGNGAGDDTAVIWKFSSGKTKGGKWSKRKASTNEVEGADGVGGPVENTNADRTAVARAAYKATAEAVAGEVGGRRVETQVTSGGALNDGVTAIARVTAGYHKKSKTRSRVEEWAATIPSDADKCIPRLESGPEILL